MRVILLYLIFLLATTVATAQKVSKQYLPTKGKDTPAFMRLFYTTDAAEWNNFDLDKLDAARAAYEKEERAEQKREGKARVTNIKTGEENENAYILFYDRWRKARHNDVPELPVAPSNAANKMIMPNAWSLLGPKETIWMYEDNALQPKCAWQVNLYAFAVAASNTNTLYAASETGGIYKTTNKALNWTYVLDEATTYEAVAIDPTDPNKVYIGASNSVKTTVNGGANWVGTTPACGTTNAFAINPTLPSTVYMASEKGLFVSTNSGGAWAVVAGMTTTIYDVFYKIGDPNTVFALKDNAGKVEFWKSTNGGTTWAVSMSGWAAVTSAAARMTVTAADANRLYAVILGATVPSIYRSNDGGSTWTLACISATTSLGGDNTAPLGMSNGQGYYDLDIVANNANADEVLVGTTSSYKSVDGGSTFEAFGGYQGTFETHPDIQEMINIGGDTWVSTDGGLGLSTDFFTALNNFSIRTNGIFGSDFWGFSQGWNEDVVVGGRYHNGNTSMSETYPSGQSIRLGGGEAPTGYYMIGRPRSVVFSDIDPIRLSVAPNAASGTFAFTKYPNEDGYGSDPSDIEFAPYCYNQIYTGSGNEFWRSANGGASWTSLYNFGALVKHFKIARSNPNTIYLATASALYKSIDGGTVWATLTRPASTSMYALEIAVDYANENNVWISSPSNANNRKIYKSIDGGTTWINLTTATINGRSFTNMVLQQGTNGGIYLLAKKGDVFYRNNTMPDWVDYSAGLTNSTPQRSAPFYRDGKLRTGGTHGVWEIPFYENSVPLAQPTVDKLTSQCVRDTFYFEDYSAFKHAGGTWAWTFGGTSAPTYVSSTTARNPKVVFGAIGTYDFLLTVTNAEGSSTKAINGKIQITENLCIVDTLAGKALSLAAAGDFAEQVSPINVTTNTITLSCWVKPSGIQSSSAGIIFSGSGSATGMNFVTNNRIGYHWADGAGSYNWSGGPIIPADVWSHIALVINGTSATVYFNGVASPPRTATHNAVNFNSPFRLGINRTNTARNYKGLMDEVCIYNRALTANEIRELMNLTKNNPNAGTLPAVDAGLLSYYQFNEGNGKPAYDKIKNLHLNMLGATATKGTISTAPVGGGTVSRLAVTTGGAKTFVNPNVVLTFPTTGTLPQGDLVVTRINSAPDAPCSTDVLPNPATYYIVRNYGTNATFASLTGFQVNSVKGTNAATASSPTAIDLYKRGSVAEGNTWGTKVATATTSTDNGGTGSIGFTTGLSVTSFSQFAIGVNAMLLPVNLLKFTFEGSAKNGVVKLLWLTANEINFKDYDVERADDAQNFKKIGTVTAAGATEYRFADASPNTGINYYRLRLNDRNGTYSYSSIISVSVGDISAGNFKIQPNPSQDGWFSLNCKDAKYLNETATCTIYTALGQVINTIQINSGAWQQPIHFNIPNSGVYFLSLRFGNGGVVTKKLVVD